MGFFKKKKKEEVEYNLLSKEGIIAYFKDNLKNPTDKNVANAIVEMAKPDADQEHLTKNGELPWGWLRQNAPILKTYENEMVQMAVNLNNYEGTDKIKPLEELIKYYYNFKDFCYSKNECYIKWFQDMWEHCHNSRCKDFEYIEPYEKELEELKGQE